MDLLWTKVLALSIIGLGSLFSGLAALPVSDRLVRSGKSISRRQILISSLLSCLGGGVLLATTMIHILPEVTHNLREQAEKIELESLPQLVVCAGFFFIYLVEEVVGTFLVAPFKTEHDCCKGKDDCHSDMEMTNSPSPSASGTNVSDGSDRKTAAFRDFFTILALSTHSVLEGLAVGLGLNNSDVWTLTIAIACHKFIISFCVCMELLEAGTKRFIFYSYLAVFSLTSCLGIAAGILITEAGGSQVSDVLVNTLQGLAAGTLLYVVMLEVLSRERQKHLPGLLQFTAVILGFIIMLIIQLFVHEPED